MEANLPIDVRARTLLDGTEPWKPLPRMTAAILLARVLGPPTLVPRTSRKPLRIGLAVIAVAAVLAAALLFGR